MLDYGHLKKMKPVKQAAQCYDTRLQQQSGYLEEEMSEMGPGTDHQVPLKAEPPEP